MANAATSRQHRGLTAAWREPRLGVSQWHVRPAPGATPPEETMRMVSLQTREYQLEAKRFIDNPSQDELHQYTAEMPNAKPTVYGNLDVFTRVDARSTASTYIVTDDPAAFHGLQVMSRKEYESITEMQERYIREQEMIVIDGEI